MIIRHAEPSDHARVITVIDEWWGGRHMSDMMPKLFFIHFKETCFVAEEDGVLVGFLSGFLSQTFRDEAYIHFVGVDLNCRQAGMGRALYERFFEMARSHGRSVIRCVTSPVNKTSIAFHTRIGFDIEPGNGQVDGVSVHRNYDGRGGDRVLFVKAL